jgi:tRNA(Leu) C34 or U34 (ribose-2'-O)-methylase TrmL
VGGATRPVAGARFPCADGKLIEAGTHQHHSKKILARKSLQENLHKKTRGARVVTTKTAKDSSSEQQGFCTSDVLWAVGIWSVILTLSPVVIFYLLMVN